MNQNHSFVRFSNVVRITDVAVEGLRAMNCVVRAILAAIMAIAAGPAIAADWWLVSGVPNPQVAVFADVETLARQDDAVRLRVLRIDRSGRSAETFQHIRCSGDAESRANDTLRRFACSSDQDRVRFGLILAGMNPEQVAEMTFGIGSAHTPPDRSYPAD